MNKFEEKVGLIKMHPLITEEEMLYYKKNKYKGLVIEATGLGHTPIRENDSFVKAIKEVVDAVDPTINVGAYFRFNNNGDGEKFNKLISEYGFNKQLDNNNRVSIIANGKIPKFFLKSDWYPKTVISFSNHFRSNKTSVYCNSCDLIVYYTSSKPMIGIVDVIV